MGVVGVGKKVEAKVRIEQQSSKRGGKAAGGGSHATKKRCAVKGMAPLPEGNRFELIE